MRIALQPISFLLALLCLHLQGISQDAAAPEKITAFPERFISRIKSKSAALEAKLDRQTEKYLQRLLQKEKKLQRKLARTDAAAAAELFGNAEAEYAAIGDKMKATTASENSRNGQYLPYVDSLKASLSFLQQHNHLLDKGEGISGANLQQSLAQVKNLQAKLGTSEEVKAFIRQRKEQIKQTLSKYTQLPKGLRKTYTDFNKDLYYYSQQVKEYKDLLNDPDKLTRKALGLLTQLDVFKDFMQQHSELAGLFGMPANYGTPQALTGLQTRNQVQQLIQSQLAASGPNAQQALQQNLQNAQAQLSQLKDKINKLGGGDSDLDLPDFKPNNQKTKSFLQRLEFGTNLQSTRSNYFFPTTTDLGLSIGYKLSDNSVIGIGGSYKVGWGKDIRNIVITSEGAGIRSFLDVRLKKSFFITGGYEQNYQPLTLTSPGGGGLEGAVWTSSGLIGLSKVVSLKTKFFKKTKVQLLWDFLSYEQVPQTQAVKFRVGYSF